jgi:hypothetical protein
MRYGMVALLVLMFTTLPGARAATQLGPRFDGLYQSVTDQMVQGDDGQPVHSTFWMRFYTDGTVLAATTQGGTASVVQKWLVPGSNAYIPQGKFTVAGNSIKFTVTTPLGTVDYDGTIDGDQITFNVQSHINQKSVQGLVYTFVPVSP